MPDLQAQMPSWSQHLFMPGRYKVFYGGRGAARSWSYARALLIMGAQRKLRILCCREFQKSIADSVHKLIEDQITLLRLPGWHVGKTEIVHAGTGTTIIFEGLRYNVNRVKSLEGIDICWVEEAESVTKDSWEILIPTIRKPGSQIWISFNPDLEEDATYQRFVVNQPPSATVIKVGWQNNPWFPDTLAEERDYLYRVDPEAAENVWGGFPKKSSDAQILKDKWHVEAFTPKKSDPRWLGPFYGADFGFAEDPTTCVECWIFRDPKFGKGSQGELYIRRESWKLRLDIHRITRAWYPVFSRHLSASLIRADSSRPETISYLRQHGLRNMRSVFKWQGSVEDGIAFLRGFERIVIHPDCPKTREEARLWSYKVDAQTQEILAKVVDKHNHCWDAVRYALQPMIRARKNRNRGYTGASYANAG